MNKIIKLLFCSILLFSSCKDVELEHFQTVQFKKEGLFLEKMIEKGGVYEGNEMYFYLTDSSSFRKFLGKTDDNEAMTVNIVKGEIFVKKYIKKSKAIKESNNWSIRNLKEGGEFD